MENTSIKNKILFNILVVLTILFIYFLFFPKNSYVKTKLDEELNPIIEESFSKNMNSLKIASVNYLDKNESESVTLQELIDKNLLVDLIDSNGNTCDTNSYVKKTEDGMIINLKCSDKEDTITIRKTEKEKLLCLYEYRKETETGYSDWSEWSDWSTEPKEKNDLTNVETKTEQEENGTTISNDVREIRIDAYKNNRIACPSGFEESNGKCKKRKESNSISASISYNCPNGYNRNGLNCYNNQNVIEATKNYYCPTNQSNIEFELVDSTCKTYYVTYVAPIGNETYYTCPAGYTLSGENCYTTEEYETEETDYKEVTYYRYQTRNKIDAKFDIIWSSKDDKELLNNSYNMIRKVTCEF